MNDNEHPRQAQSETPHLSGEDEEDYLASCYKHLRGTLQSYREAPRAPSLSCQKEAITEWADRMGLLLDPDSHLPRLQKGGQEHDYYYEGESIVKVTKSGIFGLSPGMDLALVASGDDARRFHLWEATPLQYLERLILQNQLTPELNQLKGILIPAKDEVAIVTSQPYFKNIPVSQQRIDTWFDSLGFRKITSAAYYREEDNLGIFDAHDKNLFQDQEDETLLIPFDVIPCHPDGGFLDFINDSIEAGQSLSAVRSATAS